MVSLMGEKVYLSYYELNNMAEYGFIIIGVSQTYEGAQYLIDEWLNSYGFTIDPTEETVDIYEITLNELF